MSRSIVPRSDSVMCQGKGVKVATVGEHHSSGVSDNISNEVNLTKLILRVIMIKLTIALSQYINFVHRIVRTHESKEPKFYPESPTTVIFIGIDGISLILPSGSRM
jgi:hypothetical protein